MIEQLLQADRLLTVDQVDRAREMYAQVAQLDPRNAIAVVGLARCALADGDDRGAFELAATALRIDPENDMARRMEARLAEVLAERGQPVERGAPMVSPPAPASDGPASGQPTNVTGGATTPNRSLLARLLGR